MSLFLRYDGGYVYVGMFHGWNTSNIHDSIKLVIK